MPNSDGRETTTDRDQRQRYEQIKRWAAYVRSNPDEQWGSQVNVIVDAQLSSARHYGDDRPSIDDLRDSPLFDPD